MSSHFRISVKPSISNSFEKSEHCNNDTILNIFSIRTHINKCGKMCKTSQDTRFYINHYSIILFILTFFVSDLSDKLQRTGLLVARSRVKGAGEMPFSVTIWLKPLPLVSFVLNLGLTVIITLQIYKVIRKDRQAIVGHHETTVSSYIVEIMLVYGIKTNTNCVPFLYIFPNSHYSHEAIHHIIH